MTVEESLSVFERIASRGRDAGLWMTCTIGAAFGCPYGGEVLVKDVVMMAARAVASGAHEIAIADTIGVGVPTQVQSLAAALQDRLPGFPFRIHLHNTRNTGFANAVAAIEAGIMTLDASVGGIGGCPFAPDAAGNIGSEDLVFLLERMGMRTGIDLEATMATARWMEGHLGHRVSALLSRAGVFPAAVTEGPTV
jgi:hydroxymethylglutaryl-CoA lyase